MFANRAVYGDDARRLSSSTSSNLGSCFRRAAHLLGMQPTYVLLHLGAQVCGSAAALKAITSLLAPRKGQTVVDKARLLRALNEQMWGRHDAAELGDAAPELTIRDVAVVKNSK